MKISIVTAVYNRVSTIEASMRSVQAQAGVEIEHIIQDGGSTDGTLDVVSRLARVNTHLENARDRGIYDAINRGISRSTGDIIGLMHSDDAFAAPDILADVARAFEDPMVDGVYGDLDYVSGDDANRIIRRWRAGPFDLRKIRRGWMPPHPTLYLRREVFDRWGNYDPDFRIAADYDAMLRWILLGRIRLTYVPRVFVKMRVGGASNRSISQVVKKSREDYRAIRRNGAGGIGTLAWKNLSKLGQFVGKREAP
ncbi:glycosyltransferase family 2 protein [Sinisalibacter aestuarii]|uniref:Glycosyl transferase n=1 Tax=Sinisalibacter aestuarii TaxID=2949426 RepID=A0ABQ5LX79_9RHOB|nr:glycosyltransferase family 2 protein [Sinisalibacter aestuarii]GKY89223.1 glycosyl transferase [Sinisalibacter aestuarii]